MLFSVLHPFTLREMVRSGSLGLRGPLPANHAAKLSKALRAGKKALDGTHCADLKRAALRLKDCLAFCPPICLSQIVVE